VLVATVALVIGFVTSALPPIYVSIACSVLAALVLFLFSRISKRVKPAGVAPWGLKDTVCSAAAMQYEATVTRRRLESVARDRDSRVADNVPLVHCVLE
jgi:hypothetical protein